jgi:serine/threonine protein kinase
MVGTLHELADNTPTRPLPAPLCAHHHLHMGMPPSSLHNTTLTRPLTDSRPSCCPLCLQAVVAKVLHLTTSLSHAQTELSALAAATHSGATHVVSLLGVGLDLWSLSPALLLEAGEQTLSERVRAEGALSEAAARKVVREVLLGLQQLQEAGWAHGDVKPGNVVEAQGVAKLADIGSAVPLTTAAAASAAAAGVEGTVTVQSVQHQPHEGEEHAGTAVALAGANAPELPALTPNSGGRQQRSFRGSRVYAAPELLVEVAATTAAAAAAAADIGPQGLSSGSRLQATALEEGAAATAAASSSTAGRRPRRRGPASVTTAAGAAAAAHVAGADVPGATKAAAAAAATAAQAADVWSVGCLLLFLATGRHPRDLPVDQLAAAASAGEGGAVQVVLQKYIAAVTGAGGEPPTAQQQQQQSQQQQQQQQAQETEAPPQEAGSPSKRRRLQLHMQLALPDGHPPNSEGGEFVLHLEPGVVEARAASTQPNSHRQQQLQEEEAFRIGVPAPPDALPSAPHGAAADGGSGGLLPTAPCWLSSSPGALQVAAACLQPDPGRRPSVEQLLRLPWLTAE